MRCIEKEKILFKKERFPRQFVNFPTDLTSFSSFYISSRRMYSTQNIYSSDFHETSLHPLLCLFETSFSHSPKGQIRLKTTQYSGDHQNSALLYVTGLCLCVCASTSTEPTLPKTIIIILRCARLKFLPCFRLISCESRSDCCRRQCHCRLY